MLSQEDVILTSALILVTIAVSAHAQADNTTVVWECDFEETSPCGLVQDPTDTFLIYSNTSYDWQVLQGITPTRNTGPEGAQSNTFYYYVEVSNADKGDFTRFASARLNHVGSACMNFWYYMYGEHIAQLMVYVQGDLLWGTGELVFLENGDLGQEWRLGKLNIELTDATQRVVFHGVCGDGFQADIAIDNVEIFSGSCTGILRLTPTMAIRYRENSVIPADAVLCPSERLQCVWSAPPSNANATLKWVLASDNIRLTPADTGILNIPEAWRGQVLTARCIATAPAGYDVSLDIILTVGDTDCPPTTTTTTISTRTTSSSSTGSSSTAPGNSDSATGGGDNAGVTEDVTGASGSTTAPVEDQAGGAVGAVVASARVGLAALTVATVLFSS